MCRKVPSRTEWANRFRRKREKKRALREQQIAAGTYVDPDLEIRLQHAARKAAEKAEKAAAKALKKVPGGVSRSERLCFSYFR